MTNVIAHHIECVDVDHNKYYRTFVLEGGDRPNFLIRNWGRRGAPTGQWLKDPARGPAAANQALDLLDTKVWGKNYQHVYDTTFEVPDDIVDDVAGCQGKGISPDIAERLTEGFDATWLADVLAEREVESGDTVLAVFNDWDETIRARPAARSLAETLAVQILHRGSAGDLAVVKLARGEIAAVSKVFEYPAAVADSLDDDADTVRVALRLWNPASPGPYQHWATAVRDARRLFRRSPVNT
jgi:predicted DNA-binding WGR domain protein